MIFKTYESEEQQVEALKEWWKENRLPLAAGIIFGLGGIFGYQTWQQHKNDQAESASTGYETVRGEISAANLDGARSEADALVESHRNSPYAALAQFALAKAEADAGNHDAAAARLDWVLRYADDSGLRDLARLRKARVLWAGGRTDDALATIEVTGDNEFSAAFLELKGDILAATGKREEARAAYRDALTEMDVDVGRQLLEQKLTDLKMAGDA